MSDADARQWGLFLHLSALSGFVVPFGTLLGPIILWAIKKDESAFIDRHGKAAINFHLSLLLYVVAGVIVFVVLTIATLGIGAILLFPAMVLGIIAVVVLEVVFPILAALAANKGEEYRYPLAITFLKAPAGAP